MKQSCKTALRWCEAVLHWCKCFCNDAGLFFNAATPRAMMRDRFTRLQVGFAMMRGEIARKWQIFATLWGEIFRQNRSYAIFLLAIPIIIRIFAVDFKDEITRRYALSCWRKREKLLGYARMVWRFACLAWAVSISIYQGNSHDLRQKKWYTGPRFFCYVNPLNFGTGASEKGCARHVLGICLWQHKKTLGARWEWLA